MFNTYVFVSRNSIFLAYFDTVKKQNEASELGYAEIVGYGI